MHALDAGMSGPIEPAAAWTMKHPPRQMIDTDARLAMEEFIAEAVAKRKTRDRQQHQVPK